MRKMKMIFKIIILSIIVLRVVIISGFWVYHSAVMKKGSALTSARNTSRCEWINHVYGEGDGELCNDRVPGVGTSALRRIS